MDYATATYGLNGSVQALIDQSLSTAMPAWQLTGLARLTSTQATLTADGRVDAVIQSMSATLAWSIDDNMMDSANLALSSLMGSIGSLGVLMNTGIGLTGTTTQATDNGDSTVTVSTTVTHDPGVALIMERFDTDSAAPATGTGAWLADSLSQSGTDATDNIAAFSASLPAQLLDFVRAGAASSSLGAALVIDFSAYF